MPTCLPSMHFHFYEFFLSFTVDSVYNAFACKTQLKNEETRENVIKSVFYCCQIPKEKKIKKKCWCEGACIYVVMLYNSMCEYDHSKNCVLKCHKMFIAVRLNAKKWAQFFLPFCFFNIFIFLAFNASTFLSQLVFKYHVIIFHFQLLWHQLRREMNKKSAWRKNWKGALWSPAYIY